MARFTVGPASRPGDKKRRTQLEALYAELPSMECRGLCSESCGPVMMSRLEWQAICRRIGREPRATATLTCPMLSEHRCTVYDIRPTICRLWGLVDDETMRCPHGCVPDRWLTREEGYAFLRRAREISG